MHRHRLPPRLASLGQPDGVPPSAAAQVRGAADSERPRHPHHERVRVGGPAALAVSAVPHSSAVDVGHRDRSGRGRASERLALNWPTDHRAEHADTTDASGQRHPPNDAHQPDGTMPTHPDGDEREPDTVEEELPLGEVPTPANFGERIKVS